MVVTYRIRYYYKDCLYCSRKESPESEEVPIDKPHNLCEISPSEPSFISYSGLLHALIEDMSKQKEPVEVQYEPGLNLSFGAINDNDNFSHEPIGSLVNIVNELITLRNLK